MLPRQGATFCCIVFVLGIIYSALGLNRAIAETSKAGPLLFSSMRLPNEKAVLDVTERSCFSGYRYRLEYTPYPTPRISVYTFESKWGLIPHTRKEWSTIDCHLLGTVTLTTAQLKRLDNRLRFYRNKHISGLDHQTVLFATFQSGRKTHSEIFLDSSGLIDMFADADPDDIKDYPEKAKWFPEACPVLSRSRLFEIAEQAGKQGKPLPYKDVPRNRTMAWVGTHADDFHRNLKPKTQELLQKLPNWATMEGEFIQTKASHASFTSYSNAIEVILKARKPRLIDRVTWYNPINGMHGKYDWSDLRTPINTVEGQLQKIPWLSEWKAESPQHAIHLVVVGTEPCDDPELKTDVYSIWRQASLPGLPEYHIYLEDGYHSAGLFGNSQTRVQLTNDVHLNKKPNSSLWIETVTMWKVYYMPAQEYGVVNPDGSGNHVRLKNID